MIGDNNWEITDYENFRFFRWSMKMIFIPFLFPSSIRIDNAKWCMNTMSPIFSWHRPDVRHIWVYHLLLWKYRTIRSIDIATVEYWQGTIKTHRSPEAVQNGETEWSSCLDKILHINDWDKGTQEESANINDHKLEKNLHKVLLPQLVQLKKKRAGMRIRYLMLTI